MRFLMLGLVIVFVGWTATYRAEAMMASTLTQDAVMTMIVEKAQRQGFPPDLALAVAEVESSFATLAVSSAGARGVMQIMPATGRGEFGLAPYELFDAATNIEHGIRFLGDLHRRYGRLDIALSHYNGGSRVRRPDGRLEVIPATRGYVQRVLERRDYYARHPLVLGASSNGEMLAGYTGGGSVRPPALEALDEERADVMRGLQKLVERNARRGLGAIDGPRERPAKDRRPIVASRTEAPNDRVAQVRGWESFQ